MKFLLEKLKNLPWNLISFKQISKWAFFCSLILTSLTYLLFPYNLLKESLLIQLNNTFNQKGLSFNAKSLRPYWFHGFDLKEIEVAYLDPEKPNALHWHRAIFTISPWKLMVGQLGLELNIEEKEGRHLSFQTSTPLSSAFSGSMFVEKTTIEFEKFDVGEIVEKMLPIFLGQSPELNAFLGPVFAKMDMSIQMTGSLSAQFQSSSNELSLLLVDVKFDGGMIDLRNDSLGANQQNVSGDSRIWIEKKDNVVQIKEGTLIKKQDIFLKMVGKVVKKNNDWEFENNSEIQIKLNEGLAKSYGFLITKLLGCDQEFEKGDLTRLMIMGSIHQPQCHFQSDL